MGEAEGAPSTENQTSARLAARRADDRSPRPPFWFVLGACVGSLIVSLAVPAFVNSPDTIVIDALGSAASDEPSDPISVSTSNPTDSPSTGARTSPADPANPARPGAPAPVVDSSSTSGSAPGAPTDVASEANAPGKPNTEINPADLEPIRIGVGIPDLGAVAALGPAYDDGDVEEQIEALIDGWRRSGRIPINGREVEFFLRSYDILDPAPKRAACKAWSRDDKVHAVFYVHSFFDSLTCLPQEEKVPLVATDNSFESWMANSHPYMFTTLPTVDAIWRNWVHWMNAEGLLEGSRIGIYFADLPGYQEAIDNTIKRELGRLGHLDKLAAEVTTDNDATGSPQDVVAVQRFQAERVNLAVLFVSAIGQTNFMQNASLQGYNPTYVASDWYLTTNDTATMTFPANQYDGSLAMTSLRFGEANAGLPSAPEAEKCVDNYERYSGRRVTASQGAAEWMALLQGCDAGELLLAALERAGTDISRESLPGYLEQTKDFPLALHADTTWTSTRHAGATQQRTLRWEAGCRCWKALGSFAPFFVP